MPSDFREKTGLGGGQVLVFEVISSGPHAVILTSVCFPWLFPMSTVDCCTVLQIQIETVPAGLNLNCFLTLLRRVPGRFVAILGVKATKDQKRCT